MFILDISYEYYLLDNTSKDSNFIRESLYIIVKFFLQKEWSVFALL